MKQIATVTIIVAHDPLNARERWEPATTLELITDVLEESLEHELAIIHAEAQPMMLRHDGAPDLDLDRRRRATEARLAEERAERNAVRLAQRPDTHQE